MGAYSRRKGATAERELCGLLREYLGVDATRNLKQYQAAQHGDIEQLIGPYLIEAKNQAKLCLLQWWAQAVAASEGRRLRAVMGDVPVLLANTQPCVAYRLPNRSLYDRWRFLVPDDRRPTMPWQIEFRYTADLGLEAFATRVREYL